MGANPANFATMRKALHNWFAAATGIPTGRVIFAGQGGERPASKPFATLMITTPSRNVGNGDEVRAVDRVQSEAVAVTTLADNTLYRVTVNGTDHDYTSDADAEELEVLGGLRQAIEDGSEPVDAEIVGGVLLVSSLEFGTTFTIAVSANLAATGQDADGFALEVGGPREMVVSLQVFGTSQANAYQLLHDALEKLSDPAEIALLDAAGLAVQIIGTVQDLTTLLEAVQEPRAQADVTFNWASSRDSADAQYIETTNLVNNTLPQA